MSPDRLPIIRPSKGLNPIEVSRLFPFLIAAILQPWPKWAVIKSKFSKGFPRIFDASFATYLWLVPWNPYLLTLWDVYQSSGTPYLIFPHEKKKIESIVGSGQWSFYRTILTINFNYRTRSWILTVHIRREFSEKNSLKTKKWGNKYTSRGL